LPGAAGPVPVRAGPAPGPRHRTGDPGAAPGPGATVTGRSRVPGPAPGSGGPDPAGPGPADPGPAGRGTADPAAGLDLRLVPAAAVGWVVCGVGVGLGADAGWLGVLVLLVAAAGGLHRQRTRVRARHRRAGNEVLAAWVLALLLAAALLATVAVRGGARADLVQQLDGTAATMTVQLQREARPHEDGALADALLVAVDGHA